MVLGFENPGLGYEDPGLGFVILTGFECLNLLAALSL